jgi:hypothetical protein
MHPHNSLNFVLCFLKDCRVLVPTDIVLTALPSVRITKVSTHFVHGDNRWKGFPFCHRSLDDSEDDLRLSV